MKRDKSRQNRDPQAGPDHVPASLVPSRFVEPEPEPSEQVVLQSSLEAAGWGADASWLAPLLVDLLGSGICEESEHARWIVRSAAGRDEREARFRELFARIAGFGSERFAGSGNQVQVDDWHFLKPMPPPTQSDWQQQLVRCAALHGIDVKAAMLGGWPEVVVASEEAAAQELRGHSVDASTSGQAEDLPRVVRWMRIVNELCPGFDPVPSAPLGDVRSVRTWLHALGARDFVRRIARSLGAMGGAPRSVDAARDRPIDHVEWSEAVLRLGEELASFQSDVGLETDVMAPVYGCVPVIHLLVQGASLDSPEARQLSDYRVAILWLAVLDRGILDPWGSMQWFPSQGVYDLAFAVAKRSLALLRSIAEHKGPEGPREASAAVAEFLSFEATQEFELAARLLYSAEVPIWPGMKPLLLALRASKSPAVAADLRYWPEHGLPNPPEPWSRIVLWMIHLFHWYAEFAERVDPALQGLRSNLAEFCLERLGDRLPAHERESAPVPRHPADMLEPSGAWRYSLIRAFQVLETDLDGRAKRMLEISARIDPEPSVREAAEMALSHLPRGHALPEGVSPRRSVLSALWWIRQGHLLALGVEPDRDGAQRTRRLELTRTRERRTAPD